jgi:hypothetical protein
VSDLATLFREVDLLEQLQKKLAEVATRDDDRRKHDLIDLRRQLSLRIAELGRVAEPVFVEFSDPMLLRDYRAKVSGMRFVAAMHQADWPAVRLGEKPDEYRASAKAVRDANREFIVWMRGVLATMR